MWLAVLYIWGSLLTFSVCHVCPETSEDVASWVTLKPLGHCGDEENLCPYRLTLPPLSIQLPRPLRELEKMAKELQDLKDVVNQLRRDCQECKDRQKKHDEGKEKRPQSGEQAVRILTSTLLQEDTSESEGTIKDGMKTLNHSILERQEWNINPRVDLNQGTTDQMSEMSREVKIFNPSLDETPEDISKVRLVFSPTPEETERELKSKRRELIESSLPRRTDAVQPHGKQQPNILRDGHAKNISAILAARRRVQNVADPNGSKGVNWKIMDLSTSAGNRRVVKFPGAGGPLRPRGSYINGRDVKITSEDRLKNAPLVRIHNLQSGDNTVKTEPEEDGYSPVRSGVMQVKEPSPHITNKKPGAPSTNDQNNQAIKKGPAQDCADYITKSRRNGVYSVTPQPRSSMFPVFCDMESSGGGWTLIQHRFDGSTSFNRTWNEYKNGFGELTEEFWLGNDKIHLLTKAKNMSLRIEIEDFEGVKEYAHYDHFHVANESQQYRLSIGGYSGTAGNAMQFSKTYNHDQKLFTTPDRDNDHYPSEDI
ncbi:fibroleukin [Labeo rohita]|uniref:Fibroleukin n=1 Tax=Labeo rohita TaxID=84645 RepID=A0A498MB65_LABRO|nr:fibroleukin [Labeo rohita]